MDDLCSKFLTSPDQTRALRGLSAPLLRHTLPGCNRTTELNNKEEGRLSYLLWLFTDA